MTKQQKAILEAKRDGLTWKENAIRFNDLFEESKTAKAIKCMYFRIPQNVRDEFLGFTNVGIESVSSNSSDFDIQRKQYEYRNATKERIFTDIISIVGNESDITPERIMQAHNLDCRAWEVTNFILNFWEGQKGKDNGGGNILMFQSKLTVKPRKSVEITVEDIDKHFERTSYDYAMPKIPCSNYISDGEVAEILIPDLHIGLYASESETGKAYNMKRAEQDYYTAFNTIVEKLQKNNHKIFEVWLVSLGDFLHVDNNAQTTTNGTLQDVDGRVCDIVDVAERLLVNSIKIAGEALKTKVRVIYIPGNHDRLTGYMMVRGVKNLFAKDENVLFDVSPKPNKYIVHGKSLVAWTHGDMPKKNLTEWLLEEARSDMANCKYIELHTGHYHTLEVWCEKGVTVYRYPKLGGSGYWEYQQGYAEGVRCLICNVWNKQQGKVATYFAND